METALERALAPALERYSAAIAEHAGTTRDETGLPSCRCGFTPPRHLGYGSSNRSIGIHRSAAEKRASKAYDAEAAEIVHALTYGKASR